MAERGYKPYESWFRDRIQSDHGAIETPLTEARIIEILQDPKRFPSPVRPVGSRHSMTPCMSAKAPYAEDNIRWGTLIDMSEFVRLRNGSGAPNTDSLDPKPEGDGETAIVTVPAGRTFIRVAEELDRKGWLFRVNTELGTLTIGAAACGATKDSSFHGESGQVCHDVVGMRLIRPDGTIENLGEDHPDLPALRCSYGLFGIVTEVTFRVYRKYYISMEHKRIEPANGKAFEPDELRRHFAAWLGPKNSENAVFLYMFPYRDRIVAEIRGKPALDGRPREWSLRLGIRNFVWDQGAQQWERLTRLDRVPFLLNFVRNHLRRGLQNAFGKVLAFYLTKLLRLRRLNPVAQIVDFDPGDKENRFTFSMWAFPEAEFAQILPEYFALCKRYENLPEAKRFRTGLPHASYHIGKDTSSLLSYSRHGAVWTLDPICPDNVPGWHDFLKEFNRFCSEKGGIPLLNQTPFLTRGQVARAFADRLPDYEPIRRRYDPHGRMLNAYFADVFDVKPVGGGNP